MYIVKPYIIKDIHTKNLVWRIHTSKKEIFLTFDDGPIPESTETTLKILEEFDAKATFFCVGDNVKKYPALFEKIISSGHSVGNHTFNHLNGWRTTYDFYLKNIQKGTQYIESNLFRPPYGRMNSRHIPEIRKDYFIILWSVLSGDFDIKLSPERCLTNVIQHTRSGSIVVFHDNIKAIKRAHYALPRMLKYFTERGYTFKALNTEIVQNTLERNILNFAEKKWNNYSNTIGKTLRNIRF